MFFNGIFFYPFSLTLDPCTLPLFVPGWCEVGSISEKQGWTLSLRVPRWRGWREATGVDVLT
jgi:hypothetical protein